MSADVSNILLHPLVAVATPVVAMIVLLFVKPGLFLKMYFRAQLFKHGLQVKFITGKDGFKFCYAEKGTRCSNKPSILFVHGFSASKDMWLTVIKRLPKDIHMILVDLPGHGQTSRIHDDETSFHAMCHRLHEFVELIRLNSEPFHILGQSMGGAISLSYCATYPEEVSYATFICPAMRTPHENEFAKELRAGHCRLIPTTVEGIQEMMNSTMYYQPKVPKLVMKGVLQNRKTFNDFYTKLFLKLANDESADEIENLITRVTPPSQVIWGRHDILIDVSGVDILQEKLPNLQQVNIIEKCGHSCNMDRPGTLVKHIMEFRNKMEEKDQ